MQVRGNDEGFSKGKKTLQKIFVLLLFLMYVFFAARLKQKLVELGMELGEVIIFFLVSGLFIQFFKKLINVKLGVVFFFFFSFFFNLMVLGG